MRKQNKNQSVPKFQKFEPKINLGKTRERTKHIYKDSNKNIAPPAFRKNTNNISNQDSINLVSKTLALLGMCDKELEKEEFENNWTELVNLSSHLLNFVLFIPNPLNDQGKKILKNGKFLTLWLKLLSMNPYVNHRLIMQNSYQKYFDDITINKQIFQQYYDSLIVQSQTPIKLQNTNQLPPSSLKRSILKNSDRKVVQFKQDQIIYPPLENLQANQKDETRKHRKQQIRAKNGYIMDYFQINEIYLLDQIQFIGLIKQIDKYAIVLVKYPIKSQKSKEKVCIGFLGSNHIQTHNSSSLQQIEKQFQNISFIDLEGKDPSSLVVDSIPTDSISK